MNARENVKKTMISLAALSLLISGAAAKGLAAEIDENHDFLPMLQKKFAPEHADRTPEFNVVFQVDPACPQDNGCRAETAGALRCPEPVSFAGGGMETGKLMIKIHEWSATTKYLKM
ncbi:MAG: hypothetical protein E4H46_01900 [Desulfobacterales bacterium]|nr:MAG: hypothetical protein E4H46_01900 [Desulfobacterales bacterium]